MENQANHATSPQNPNDILAERIFQQLLDQGLVKAHGKALFIHNLSAGALRESDWKTALQASLQPQSPQY